MCDALTKKRLANQIADGYPISIGRGTYGGPRLLWSHGDFSHSLRIGAFCSIADGVTIFVGSHGRHAVDYASTYPLGMVYGRAEQKVASKYEGGNLDVEIGNDVWIGRDALIMAGVTIGDGAVIAARAVVTKDVPPYSIVSGVPARVVRQRFSDEIIRKLLLLKWWDWTDALIAERLQFFNTPLFEELLDSYLSKFSEIAHDSRKARPA